MAESPVSVLTDPAEDQLRAPSMGDLRLSNEIRMLWDEAKDARRDIIAKWRFFYELLHNERWTPRQPLDKPNTDMPEMYPIVSAMIGWMTDQQPTTQISAAADPFTPYAGFMQRLAEDLQTVMEANWSVYGQDAELEKMLWDAHTYGIGFIKDVWDPVLEEGLGNAITRRVDPFTFYVDPRATSMDDANYFLEVRTYSLQELDRRWPGSAKRVLGITWDEGEDRQPTEFDGRIGRTSTATNPYTINGGSATALLGNADARKALFDRGATVIEAWLREHEIIDGKVVDGWRCVVVTGNHVLMDEPAKNLWDHGRHPYNRYVLIETGQFYGKGLVELLAPAQLELNYLLGALGSNIRLVGNPVMVEDDDALTQRTRLAARPGQRLTKRRGSQIEYLVPPQMHPQIVGFLVQFYTSRMEAISGLSAINRGYTPTGRNASDVMDSVQEAAFVRIRLSVRNLERTLTRSGQLIASLIVQFYDEARVVAITGPEGTKSALALRAMHFYTPSKKGRVPLKFSLIVDAGSSLPTSKRARVAEMDTLYAMGALDVPAILEIHNVPNRDKIWQRISTLMAAGMFNPPGARQRTRR